MMLDYLGRTIEEMKSPGDERIKRDLHPDDRERVQAERSAGLSQRVPFEIEKRSLGKDGQFRWFLFRYKPLLDEKGHIAKWFVTATDIEERKQAEERMRNEAFALREEIEDGVVRLEVRGGVRFRMLDVLDAHTHGVLLSPWPHATACAPWRHEEFALWLSGFPVW